MSYILMDTARYRPWKLGSHEALVVKVFTDDEKEIGTCSVVASLLECGVDRFRTDNGHDIKFSAEAMIGVGRLVLRGREKLREGPKTLERWSESGLPFMDYCSPGEPVDCEIVEYFLNILPPVSNSYGYIQCGEPVDIVKDDVGSMHATYMTFIRRGSQWIYAGTCQAGQAGNGSSHISNLKRWEKVYLSELYGSFTTKNKYRVEEDLK